MMPGGHLVTAAALSVGAYVLSGSAQLAVGCFAGGFLIDVDHYVDYLVFERQWRRPWPGDFLTHYFSYKLERIVLPLHSVELMALLAIIALLWRQPLLLGYLLGAAMHLFFDMVVNGEHVLRRPFWFYSFVHRASLSFAAAQLLEARPIPPGQAPNPFKEFFGWRPSKGGNSPVAEAVAEKPGRETKV